VMYQHSHSANVSGKQVGGGAGRSSGREQRQGRPPRQQKTKGAPFSRPCQQQRCCLAFGSCGFGIEFSGERRQGCAWPKGARLASPYVRPWCPGSWVHWV
jgi:hypothetical protein